MNIRPADYIYSEFAALASGDLERIGSYFTEDCVFTDVPAGITVNGRDELQAYCAPLYVGFPDFHISSADLLFNGHTVAGKIELAGTHDGEILGVAPTGRTIRWKAFVQLDLTDDHRMCHHEIYNYDLVALTQQLGA